MDYVLQLLGFILALVSLSAFAYYSGYKDGRETERWEQWERDWEEVYGKLPRK